MKNTITIYGTIQKETEKAINVTISWEHPETMSKNNWTVWMPKSQVTVEDNANSPEWLGASIIETPEWLAGKISKQIGDFINLPMVGNSIFNF